MGTPGLVGMEGGQVIAQLATPAAAEEREEEAWKEFPEPNR